MAVLEELMLKFLTRLFRFSGLRGGDVASTSLSPSNPHWIDPDYEIYLSADEYVLLPRIGARASEEVEATDGKK